MRSWSKAAPAAFLRTRDCRNGKMSRHQMTVDVDEYYDEEDGEEEFAEDDEGLYLFSFLWLRPMFYSRGRRADGE